MRISGQQFVWVHRIGIPGVQSGAGFQNATEDSGKTLLQKFAVILIIWFMDSAVTFTTK